MIQEGGIDKLLVAGGRNASGTIQTATYLYNPAVDTWETMDSLPTATTGGQMIAIPGTDRCLFVGGVQGTSTVATVYQYDLSDDGHRTAGGAAGWSTKTAMSNSRKQFKLTLCGTGMGTSARILAIGGIDNSLAYPTAIEMYNVNTDGGSSFGSGLSAGRSNLAVASLDTTYTKFIVPGGYDGADQSKRIDYLTADVSCGTQTSNGANNVLSTERETAVAFPTGDTNEFYVVAGFNGSNALSSAEKVTMTWNGNMSSAAVVTGTALSVARKNPKLLRYSATSSSRAARTPAT